MLPSEIMTKITAGELDIRYEQKCECHFNWTIENDSLYDAVESDCCWEGCVLYVADVAIAEVIRFGEKQVLVNGLSNCDIPDEVRDQMRTSDFVEAGDTGNSAIHDLRKREALIEWLMDAGFELDRDMERGFANEYTMILRATAQPMTHSRQDVENWVDRFLYSGDAAAQAFVGFRLE